MGRQQLLFVTYQDDGFDEGITYAIELAKAMVEDIVLLLVRQKKALKEKFEDLMAGVSFAEAGEHETARRMAAGDDRQLPEPIGSKISEMLLQSSKAGVHLEVQNSEEDVVSSIRTYLKGNKAVDKVVLSPVVTESEMLTTKDLNRLVRTASRPIVTMTRQSVRAAREERARKEERARCQPSANS